jgi:hypothetical protein
MEPESAFLSDFLQDRVLRFFWRARTRRTFVHFILFQERERDFPSGRHWATVRTHPARRERSDGIVWKFKKSPAVSPGGDVTAFINLYACGLGHVHIYIFWHSAHAFENCHPSLASIFYMPRPRALITPSG